MPAKAPSDPARFFIKCPRCGELPGSRCRPIDPRSEGQWRSNHPERNRRYTEIRADEMRSAAPPRFEVDRKDTDG